MKLSEERFIFIITYLNSWYKNFEFEIKDKNNNNEASYKFNIWYDAFKEFDEEEFVTAIKMFCRENVYAPNSPAEILRYIKEKVMTLLEMSPDEAWEKSLENLRRVGYRKIESISEKFREKGNEAIGETLLEMRSEFENLYTENLPYVKKSFKEIYSRNLRKQVEKRVSQGILTTNNNKLLGNGEE